MNKETSTGIGLLILRLGLGGMMLFAHGWGKLMGGWEKAAKFPDPLGVGNELSWMLATGAETGAALLVIFGLFARLASIPLVVTMLVAALVVHGDDPFQKKELALVYMLPFLAIIFTGPGCFSVDAWLEKRKA